MQNLDALHRAADHASTFLAGVRDRPVASDFDLDEMRARFGGPLPEQGEDPVAVIDALVAAAEPGLVATAGPRFFGFVIGGSLPTSVAADWLTSAWDQNAGLAIASPAAAVCEETVARWLLDLLGLPSDSGVGLVTGGQMANTTCLAVARRSVLSGYDIDREGLAGCPRITVVVGAEVHGTLLRSLRFLGIGSTQILTAPVDDQGRIIRGAVSELLETLPPGTPTIVCAQAGNINSGAFDPLDDIADACEAFGAWMHVDGAFGLWAAASPRRRRLLIGYERADSWAVDLHKWLNVPYDSGVAILRDAAAQNEALRLTAAYLVEGEVLRDGSAFVPELSRRARSFPAWATIRALGRVGVAALVDRCCDAAEQMARLLSQHPDVEVLNNIVINQAVIRFGDSDDLTRATIAATQASGTCWVGPTVWRGKVAMRISVSNWSTGPDDIERSAVAILALLPHPHPEQAR